jgi:hypothetical protein
MKTPNIRAIRQQLPHGSISDIANKIGVTPQVVSEFFMRGWHKEYTSAILMEAVNIIEGQYPDGDLVGKIDDLGLSGGGLTIRRKRKPVARESAGDGGNIILYVGILLLILFFLVPQFKNFVFGLFGKMTGKNETTK